MDASPDLIAKLVARIDALEAEMASLKRPAAEGAMVEAIGRANGGRGLFVLAEVAKWAAGDPALHGAITAALGADWNTWKLGKAFARLEGQNLGGLTVTKVASRKERAGVIWSICDFGR